MATRGSGTRPVGESSESAREVGRANFRHLQTGSRAWLQRRGQVSRASGLCSFIFPFDSSSAPTPSGIIGLGSKVNINGHAAASIRQQGQGGHRQAACRLTHRGAAAQSKPRVRSSPRRSAGRSTGRPTSVTPPSLHHRRLQQG